MSEADARPWRIATRRSALAQAQATQVGEALSTVTGRAYELVPLATSGDNDPERAIQSFDAKGLFVDRTRQAVLDGECDFVVHSYKDLPTAGFDGLVIAAVPRRVDPRDVLVTREGHRLAEIPRGAPFTIGTSSARRKAQIQKARRDVLVQPLRGNIDTRIRKVAEGDLDGVVIAMAGLLRSEPMDHEVGFVPLEHGEMLHAPAQGALAVECRVDDPTTRKALKKIDHEDTRIVTSAEREFLRVLEGGCTAPIGAHGHLMDGPTGARRLELLGVLSDPNGTQLLRASHETAATEPLELARTLAATLLANGGEEVVERLRNAG